MCMCVMCVLYVSQPSVSWCVCSVCVLCVSWYIHRVSPKMYSFFDCPLLMYLLFFFQVQKPVNNGKHFLKVNVYFL